MESMELAWIEGQVPIWGRGRGNWMMFLSLSFSLPLCLKINIFKSVLFISITYITIIGLFI